MTPPLTIELPVPFQRRGRGSRQELCSGAAAAAGWPPPGRVPRVARLMALALRWDALIRTGQVASYTELSILGHVTRARVCQSMNLLGLAPDLQEALLFLPRTERGRDPLLRPGL